MDYTKLRQFNKVTKHGLGKELLKFPLYFVPGVGTALMARDAIKDFRSGNKGSGLLNGAFTLMGLGAIGKAAKTAKELRTAKELGETEKLLPIDNIETGLMARPRLHSRPLLERPEMTIIGTPIMQIGGVMKATSKIAEAIEKAPIRGVGLFGGNKLAHQQILRYPGYMIKSLMPNNVLETQLSKKRNYFY